MSDIKIGYSFNTTATVGEKCLEHFGIRSQIASMYGRSAEDIVEVKMIVSEDQSITRKKEGDDFEADYWGAVIDGRFAFIYPGRDLLSMCFPYGLNKDTSFRLEIVK